MRKSEQRLAYLLLGTPVVIVFSLVLFPVVWNVWLAFHRVRLLDLRRLSWWQYPATLENFTKIFTQHDFFPALSATLMYTAGGATLALFFGLVAALAVNHPLCNPAPVETRFGHTFSPSLYVDV